MRHPSRRAEHTLPVNSNRSPPAAWIGHGSVIVLTFCLNSLEIVRNSVRRLAKSSQAATEKTRHARVKLKIKYYRHNDKVAGVKNWTQQPVRCVFRLALGATPFAHLLARPFRNRMRRAGLGDIYVN